VTFRPSAERPSAGRLAITGIYQLLATPFTNASRERLPMSSVPNSLPRVNWDAIGVGASTLCAIHCLLLPIVLAFAPTLAHFVPGTEVVHRALAFLLAAVGLIAFWAGYKVHRRKIVLLLLSVGIMGVTVGAYAGFLLPTHAWEVVITFFGSSFLIAAHCLNRTLCRSCRVCADQTDAHQLHKRILRGGKS
jgi:MerC mercury resistance protein